MAKDLLIRDEEYRQALDELGFCMVPLFAEAEIERIKALYATFVNDCKVSGLVSIHSQLPYEKSLEVSNALEEITKASLGKHFEDYEFFMGGFMVKGANTPNEITLHQDWKLLDESKYASYHIWIPLEFSHPKNGGMFVLPGSHAIMDNFRSGSYGIPTVWRDELLAPWVTTMNIPPCYALIFHDALFHASYPNTANTDRVAAVINIRSKNVPVTYYQKNAAEQSTDVYTIDRDIFLKNLNTLENGGVPDKFYEVKQEPLNRIDNTKISSSVLRGKLIEKFGGNTEEFESFQIHLLKDKGLERKMNEYGYAVLDFLNADEVESIKADYLKNFGALRTKTGRFTTMEDTSPETKREAHDFISRQTARALGSYLKNYQLACCTYITKYGHCSGELSLHNDASLMLNTNLEPHYAIWCPLVDVNESNGALCVVEKSHKFSNAVFLEDICWPYAKLNDTLQKKYKVIDLKAGQAVLFDLRLIHNATNNDTDEDRICFTCRITHKKSQYYSFFADKPNGNLVNVFEENADFYLCNEWNPRQAKPLKNKRVGEMFGIYDDFDYPGIEKRLANAED